MVVIKTLRMRWREILLAFLALQNAFAEMMEKGKTKVKKVFNLYHQNSNDGRQVVDGRGREETNVVEPMVFIDHQINEDTAISGRVVFDAWTAASDTKMDNYTGASGSPIMGQNRVAANLGARQEKKVGVNRWNYGVDLGFSSEYDYRSLNGSLNVSRSFAKDNFTLGGSLQYYLDEVDLFKDISNPAQATISTGNERKILATTLTASQIITTRDIFQVGLTFARSEGTLESTANTVDIGGTRQVEVLPDTRARYAISSKWVHGLGQSGALNFSYRYYWDQWDLDSHTLRAAYLFDIVEDESYMEVFTRFHSQSQVEYYGDSFTQRRTFMTSDSDMADFSSVEAGVHYETFLDDRKKFGIDFSEITFSQGFVYAQRSNGMRYGYYQAALGYSF